MLTSEICEAILQDHYRKPRHSGVCECGLVRTAENPACGDVLRVSLKLDEARGRIACVRFEGAGCAASQSGASLILGLAEGLPVSEAICRIEDFCKIMELGRVEPGAYYEQFGDAAALFVFAALPARVTCATLAARLLMDMLHSK